jgi:hypothetical protein
VVLSRVPTALKSIAHYNQNKFRIRKTLKPYNSKLHPSPPEEVEGAAVVLGHVPQLPEGQRPLVAFVKAAEQGLKLLGRKPAALGVLI